MPSFNPAPFDPSKPEGPGSTPLTSDQRAQHTNGNTAFTGAHADVTALEGTAPTADQKAALDAAQTPSGTNEYVTLSRGDGRYLQTLPANVAYIDVGNAWSVAQQFPANTNFLDAAFIQGPTPTWSLIDTDVPAGEEVQMTGLYSSKTYTWRVRTEVGATLRVPFSISGQAGVNGGVVVGAPTGSFQGEGILNATELHEDGVRVYSPGNPPPGGSGHTIQDEGTPLPQRANLNFVGSGVTVTDGGAGPDSSIVTIPGGGAGGIGVGSPFVAGDLMAVESATPGSETAETVGFAPADVVRLSIANVFTATPQTIQNSGTTSLDLYQTGQLSQSGRMYVSSDGGFLTVTSRNDAGAAVGNSLLSVAHRNNVAAAGVIIGNVAFQGADTLSVENGVYDGSDRVYSAGNPQPSPLTTKGDIYVRTDVGDARQAAGTNGQVIVYDSSEATGLKAEDAQALSPTQADGDIIVRQGATDIHLPIGPTVGDVLEVKSATTLGYTSAALRTDISRTLSAQVGVGYTNRDVSAATFTPNIGTEGQLITLTNATPTVNLPTGDDGPTMLVIPAATTPALNGGYTVKGAKPGSGDAMLQVWKAGTRSFAIWSDAA